MKKPDSITNLPVIRRNIRMAVRDLSAFQFNVEEKS